VARPGKSPRGVSESASVTPKQSVTIRLDRATVEHFKRIAGQSGIPYQTLINLYLRDCAATGRTLDMSWQRPPSRKA